jgi:hypothetical protein
MAIRDVHRDRPAISPKRRDPKMPAWRKKLPRYYSSDRFATTADSFELPRSRIVGRKITGKSSKQKPHSNPFIRPQAEMDGTKIIEVLKCRRSEKTKEFSASTLFGFARPETGCGTPTGGPIIPELEDTLWARPIGKRR